METNDTVLDLIKDLTNAKLSGASLTAETIAVGISEAVQFDPRIVEWVTDNTKVTATEFRRAVAKQLHKDKVTSEFGRVPKDAVDLVNLYVEKHRIECFHDGSIMKTRPPVMVVAGEKIVVTRKDAETSDEVGLWLDVFHSDPMTTFDVERELRILSSRLKLGFTRDEVADATYTWHAQAKKDRLFHLLGKVGAWKTCGLGQGADDLWREVALKCFDCSEVGVDFVVAALKKFMHQVKRKMRGLPVYDHLMIVLLGPQGAGKSSFVKAMFSPLKELAVETSFKQIEDDRNIDLWQNYILFLDEMGHAARADMEATKHAITATTLTRRPMRHNNLISVLQKGTFIGCSNKELEQLIKDPTGIRRFLGLQFLDKGRVDWDFINSIDWLKLWESVDPEGDCPMKDFSHDLSNVQEATRELGRVEAWLRDFDVDDYLYKDKVNPRGRISSMELYGVFRTYEDFAFPGSFKISKNEWDHEMKRLKKNKPEAMIFEKVRESSGIVYRFTGRVHASAHEIGPNVVQMPAR